MLHNCAEIGPKQAFRLIYWPANDRIPRILPFWRKASKKLVKSVRLPK